jgi:hypothetical protein
VLATRSLSMVRSKWKPDRPAAGSVVGNDWKLSRSLRDSVDRRSRTPLVVSARPSSPSSGAGNSARRLQGNLQGLTQPSPRSNST